MKVLVIGGGAREHAICASLAKSVRITELHCAPGNAGIAEIARIADVSASNISNLKYYVKQQGIDLTIVGPEQPLCEGIVDSFRADKLRIFGPTKRAAELEGSKIFSKELMKKYGIPTARFEVLDSAQRALEVLEAFELPVVVKADGLAGGKGAVICKTRDDAEKTIHGMMEDRMFGSAGERVVIEEFLEGTEISLFALVDKYTVAPLIPARDYKRVRDGDEGPNTGGMGSFAWIHLLDSKTMKKIEEEILVRTVLALRAEGITYNGVIFYGLMLTRRGPMVLEYNCRFGDPETQVVLPLIRNDLLDLFEATIENKLTDVDLDFSEQAGVCVVLASEGYPGDYLKGRTVIGLDNPLGDDVYVFHAGTKKLGDKVVTTGGRVLSVCALGDSIEAARKKVYENVDVIHFDGVHYRTDIAAGVKS
ncbi:MAG: phosphoribosylamine--glycine ligase [Planctomycetes bacterium]|nr:phosphoribosylamine--glycine ligase [Planctomycetota bacterium]